MATYELLQLRLRGGDDVVSLRHLAGRAARLVGLDESKATRVATSVSELGRLAQLHLPVVVRIRVTDARPDSPASLRIEFTFSARKPAELLVDDPVYVTIARLMDDTELTPNGVVIGKRLSEPVPESELDVIRQELLVDPPGDLRSVLHGQNQELVDALLALRERESELVSLNAELEQTNRGVVALYAELEQRAAEIRAAHRIVFEELERTLRPPAPVVAGVELDVRYLPAQADSPTGGDLYDWLVLPDGSVHIAVVDVQGHGVTGTRDALLVTHALRTLTLEGHGLDRLLRRTDALLQATESAVIATSIVARFDPVTGVLQLAGAGHPPALLVPPSDPVRYLETTGRPFGYPEAGQGAVVSTQLAPGDCVLMYTDGLIEIRRDILEGLDTLAGAAAKARDMRMPQLLDTVIGACAKGELLRDDTLLLALRWSGAAGADHPS